MSLAEFRQLLHTSTTISSVIAFQTHLSRDDLLQASHTPIDGSVLVEQVSVTGGAGECHWWSR